MTKRIVIAPRAQPEAGRWRNTRHAHFAQWPAIVWVNLCKKYSRLVSESVRAQAASKRASVIEENKLNVVYLNNTLWWNLFSRNSSF